MKRPVLFYWVTFKPCLCHIYAKGAIKKISRWWMASETAFLPRCKKRSIQLEASLLLNPTSNGNFLREHFYSTVLFVYATKCSIDQWSFHITAGGFMASNMNPMKTLFNNITQSWKVQHAFTSSCFINLIGIETVFLSSFFCLALDIDTPHYFIIGCYKIYFQSKIRLRVQQKAFNLQLQSFACVFYSFFYIYWSFINPTVLKNKI